VRRCEVITAQQVDELLEFRPSSGLMTNLYLNVDPQRHPHNEHEVVFRRLWKEKRAQIRRDQLPAALLEGVEADLERMERYLLQELHRDENRGLAIFSCAADRFWHVYALPRPVRDQLVLTTQPYARQLIGILENYHRYCVVLVATDRARVFMTYLDHISEHTEVLDDVPPKVREAGFSGYDEKRMEGHHRHLVNHHLRNVAETVFDFYKRERFDGLILGGRGAIVNELEPALHSYLQERIVAHLPVDVNTKPESVLEKARAIEEEERGRRHEALLKKIQAELRRKKGAAVAGLGDTLGALQWGKVHTLVVREGFTHPGKKCSSCGLLAVATPRCPYCHKDVVDVEDVVEEAIEMAFQQRCEVEIVKPHPLLERFDNVAGTLRFV
jgi:peptide chain release factor subunit 1